MAYSKVASILSLTVVLSLLLTKPTESAVAVGPGGSAVSYTVGCPNTNNNEKAAQAYALCSADEQDKASRGIPRQPFCHKSGLTGPFLGACSLRCWLPVMNGVTEDDYQPC